MPFGTNSTRMGCFGRRLWQRASEIEQLQAREFLTTLHPMLSGQRPIDLAFSELGAMRVEHVLNGILHGAAA